MQQRRLASSGRPTGTDGSDFNYRMVVDSRYQKVAVGKSRLYTLILAQAVFQLIGVVYTFLFTSKGEGPNVIAISSIAIGSISLILGDLGRRRSRVILLKVYMVASSIGVLLSIACVAKGNVTIEVFQNPSNWETHKFELLEAARTAVGFLPDFCIKIKHSNLMPTWLSTFKGHIGRETTYYHTTLHSLQVAGSISSPIGHLSFLKDVFLHGNSFTDQIPTKNWPPLLPAEVNSEDKGIQESFSSDWHDTLPNLNFNDIGLNQCITRSSPIVISTASTVNQLIAIRNTITWTSSPL